MTPSDPPTFTPETIRTVVFKRALRGYRREDVDRFMRDLADHVQAQRVGLVELEQEHARLRARVAELESPGVEGAREVAGRAMLFAQQASDELLGRTRSLCDELLQTARAEADAIAVRAEVSRRQADVELEQRRARGQELASAYTVLLHAACDEAGVDVPSSERQAQLLTR